MNRSELIESIESYSTSYRDEALFVPRFKSLLNNFENCFERSLTTGHMTASAWIVDKKVDSILLLHHKKLNRWLQPGGHADGDEDVCSVALKEAEEETGLRSLKLHEKEIFDIDIHLIPKQIDVQAHFHFDIRYLFLADKNERHIVSRESNMLQWISLGEVERYVGCNPSILRMVLKTKSTFKSSI
ncbi:MAG: NUDIX hydrolase [Cytophagales bacterium]|nr:NUDIX hydrolase [Cytophagales bacterium]